MAYLLTQETSAIEQNSLSQDGKKEDRNEEVTEVSMKLFLVESVLNTRQVHWKSSFAIFVYPPTPRFHD